MLLKSLEVFSLINSVNLGIKPQTHLNFRSALAPTLSQNDLQLSTPCNLREHKERQQKRLFLWASKGKHIFTQTAAAQGLALQIKLTEVSSFRAGSIRKAETKTNPCWVPTPFQPRESGPEARLQLFPQSTSQLTQSAAGRNNPSILPEQPRSLIHGTESYPTYLVNEFSRHTIALQHRLSTPSCTGHGLLQQTYTFCQKEWTEQERKEEAKSAFFSIK